MRSLAIESGNRRRGELLKKVLDVMIKLRCTPDACVIYRAWPTNYKVHEALFGIYRGWHELELFNRTYTLDIDAVMPFSIVVCRAAFAWPSERDMTPINARNDSRDLTLSIPGVNIA